MYLAFRSNQFNVMCYTKNISSIQLKQNRNIYVSPPLYLPAGDFLHYACDVPLNSSGTNSGRSLSIKISAHPFFSAAGTSSKEVFPKITLCAKNIVIIIISPLKIIFIIRRCKTPIIRCTLGTPSQQCSPQGIPACPHWRQSAPLSAYFLPPVVLQMEWIPV